MTVIAAFKIGGIPIVFADLLLTGPQAAPSRVMAVPAIDNVQEIFGDSGWGVSGLCQKITLISPHCVIAWAGSYAAARVAIGELRRLANKGALPHTQILEYLSREPDFRKHPVSFVGFTVEGEFIHQFHFSAGELDSPTLGKVYVGGTGAKAIHDFSELLREMEWKVSGSTHPAMSAVSQTLTLGGLLLQQEFWGSTSPQTILNMFGGGYEIAVFADGRFQKVNSITFAFLYAHAESDGLQLSMPQLILRQRYLREHLLIRAVHFNSDGADGASQVSSDQRHSIAAMIGRTPKPTITELKNFSLQSRLFNYCIVLHQQGKPSGVYTLIRNYERLDDAEMVIEERENGVFLLKLHLSLLTTIGGSLRSIAKGGRPG